MRRWLGLLTISALAVVVAWGPGPAGAITPFFTEATPSSAVYSGPSNVQPLVGDFTGDHRSDIFFYVPGAGSQVIKEGTSDRTFSTATASVSGTYIPLVGDFNGDGISDIFWYGPGKAADSLWLFQPGGGHVTMPEYVSGVYKPFVGDWAADGVSNGKTDIFWYSETGASFLWRATTGGAFQSIYEGSIGAGRVPLVGSFTPNPTDGSTDPTLDIFWYGPGPIPDVLWQGDGTGHFTPKPYTVGGNYQPVVGYFDGYGVQDIFWYSTSGGSSSVWLADPNTKVFTSHPASIGSGFNPLQGSFTLPDTPIVWWSPSGADTMWFPNGDPGTWSYSAYDANTDMGSGYIPVTGDFNGDHFNDVYWIAPGGGTSRLFWGTTNTPTV